MRGDKPECGFEWFTSSCNGIGHYCAKEPTHPDSHTCIDCRLVFVTRRDFLKGAPFSESRN